LSFSTFEGKKSRDDDEPLGSLLSSTPIENAKNDNKPPGSLSSFAPKAKQPRTTTS